MLRIQYRPHWRSVSAELVVAAFGGAHPLRLGKKSILGTEFRQVDRDRTLSTARIGRVLISGVDRLLRVWAGRRCQPIRH
jgi:hypothetical protein